MPMGSGKVELYHLLDKAACLLSMGCWDASWMLPNWGSLPVSMECVAVFVHPTSSEFSAQMSA